MPLLKLYHQHDNRSPAHTFCTCCITLYPFFNISPAFRLFLFNFCRRLLNLYLWDLIIKNKSLLLLLSLFPATVQPSIWLSMLVVSLSFAKCLFLLFYYTFHDSNFILFNVSFRYFINYINNIFFNNDVLNKKKHKRHAYFIYRLMRMLHYSLYNFLSILLLKLHNVT